jgi:lipopolysaccharide export LptBFGC system permease protein LptF
MFDWLDEALDTTVHALDVRYYWRIYLGVASGFFLVFVLSTFVPRENASVAMILLCIIVPGILGGIWHRISNKD